MKKIKSFAPTIMALIMTLGLLMPGSVDGQRRSSIGKKILRPMFGLQEKCGACDNGVKTCHTTYYFVWMGYQTWPYQVEC